MKQEEQKKECKGSFKDCFNPLNECVCDITKQETLDEVAERFSMQFLNNGDNSEFEAQSALLGVMFGAKWQQQQNNKLYSEEEVYQKLHNLMTSIKLDGLVINDDMDLKRWFNQNKKK